MVLNFGNYIFDDGIRGINGEKPKMIQVVGSSTSMNGTKPVVTKGNIDVYQQYAFNESYYNDLLNRGKFQDAVDYISRYRPVNEEQRKVFDADVASLRQQARYENNFRSNLTEDQLNRYNFYNGVFQDRGLDYIRENPYVRQFEDIKRRIGSVTTFDKDGNLVVEQEAKGLKIFFPNTKRVNRWTSWLGHDISDALQADTHNGIDNFLEYSQLNKNDLIIIVNTTEGISTSWKSTTAQEISITRSASLNLIEAYDLLMGFVAKHTSDKFHLINNVNTSVRDLIAREVIGNILVHRDYSSAYPAKVIIEKDWLKTENWCIPRRHGNIMQDEFQPYPKNPIIQRFFANIGRTDTIGSGVINLYKYTPIFSDGGKPELFEDDVFKITIPLNKEAAKEASDQKKLSDREQAIYNLICENKHLTVEQVMAEFDISRATVFRDYAKIKKITGAVYDKNESVWKL